MRNLIVIPARAGSKRLLKKNIRLFCGEPLISWTIKMAKKIPNSLVVVSSDSEEILSISREYGAKTPFIRPKLLAQDNVSAVEVLRHAVKELDFYGNVILLQPTSPLRATEDINKGLSIIKNNKAVMSMTKYVHNSLLTTFSAPGKYFKPISTKKKYLYVPNGAFYAAKSNWLKLNNSFYNDEVVTFEMPLERSIDIDYEFQFITAESIFKLNKKIGLK